jgi:cell wall-associated NlpC family hydrolase
MVRGGVFLLVVCGLATGCASTGAVPAPFPRPDAHSAPAAPPGADSTRIADPSTYAIVGTALALRGAPYRNGGTDPSGFDCSGFVAYVFAQHGLTVGRSVADQYREGRPVPADQLQPGDLVFFSTVTRGASHVGIAIGGDEFVHAPSERGEVRVEHLSAPYWSTRYLGARRMTG